MTKWNTNEIYQEKVTLQHDGRSRDSHLPSLRLLIYHLTDGLCRYSAPIGHPIRLPIRRIYTSLRIMLCQSVHPRSAGTIISYTPSLCKMTVNHHTALVWFKISVSWLSDSVVDPRAMKPIMLLGHGTLTTR
jgi:hypothetical protein